MLDQSEYNHAGLDSSTTCGFVIYLWYVGMHKLSTAWRMKNPFGHCETRDARVRLTRLAPARLTMLAYVSRVSRVRFVL